MTQWVLENVDSTQAAQYSFVPGSIFNFNKHIHRLNLGRCGDISDDTSEASVI